MKHVWKFFLLVFVLSPFSGYNVAWAQSTCPNAGSFEIDASLYPTVPGSWDWFQREDGFGVISEEAGLVSQLTNLLINTPNPTYTAPQKLAIASLFEGKILIDALFARDEFGGTGHIDQTSYVQASKNGEDPAIWAPGPANVLGKNDIIDLAGFMFRDGVDLDADLWFVGLFNMAEPGGVSYMDFEFFVENVGYTSGSGFTSGGPQLGHTAYNFDAGGNITKIGDFIFSVSLLSEGPVVETRLWVSRADWERLNGPTQGSTPTFRWAGTFDGAFNNAPFGYAGIVSLPDATSEFCGVINNTSTPAPPWGTRNTKNNVYGTSYQTRSLAEVAINLTAYGMDHASLIGDDECFFPINTFIVKTRSSASFTAQLKDFSGPYQWGSPSVVVEVVGEDLSCDIPLAEVVAIPSQPDIQYTWSTVDGNIVEQVAGEPYKIRVDKPGTYMVTTVPGNECFPPQTASAVVGFNADNPLFDEPILLATTTSCAGNDGTITLNVIGANGSYTYTWFKDGSPYTTETEIVPGDHTLGGLAPGTYTVTIQGTSACTTALAGIEVKARTPLVYTEALTNVTCFGLKNGKIELGPVTGTEPLTYLWSTGNTSRDLLNVGADSYTVQITDADGCVTEDTFTITQPAAITADIAAVDDTDPDPDVGNGSITLSNITGGTGPGTYNFQWTKERDGDTTPNFSTDQDLTNLRRGKYTVTITDANGCTFTTSANIWEPEICDDGIDNDGDGLVDCDDPVCKPAVPDGLTPDDPFPCVGEEVTYTVQIPIGVTYDSFVWSIPASTIIIDPVPPALPAGSSVTLQWTTTAGGQICVRGKVFECLSDPVCFIVNVDDVPPGATDIKID